MSNEMFEMKLNFDELKVEKLPSSLDIVNILTEYFDSNDQSSIQNMFISELISSLAQAGAKLNINGFGLTFGNYMYYLSDIFDCLPECIDRVKDLKNIELSFYEQGSMLNFNFKNNGAFYICRCFDAMTHEEKGVAENIESKCLLNGLIDLNNLVLFEIKKYYIDIYEKYLHSSLTIISH